MSINEDPYFGRNLSTINTNFLNFSHYANATNPNVFCFNGNAHTLKSKVEALTSQGKIQQFTSLRINIIGSQIKNANLCCFYTTLIVGSILVFPLFIMAFDWWKRKTNKLYHVDNQGYDALISLTQKSGAKQLYLMVQDNFFNRSKAEVLVQMLQNSKIQNFVFCNVAGAFDSDGQNYTNFQSYMKPIKSLHLRADVTWGNKAIL